MKKLLLFSSLIYFFVSNSQAQNVPNGGFENWTSAGLWENPDFWQTTDSFSITQSGMHSATKETVDIHGGSYALKLTPFTYIAVLQVPGVASNGKINTTTLSIIGGSPDTVRHATLNGWYKYAPVSGDSCSISVSLFKWNGTSRTLVASGVFGTPVAASSYTQFSINLNYDTTLTPDSMLMTIFSSPFGASHLGTVLLVDDLSFTGVVGIEENSPAEKSVNVYPIPASNEIHIAVNNLNMPNASVEFFDVLGNKVLSSELKTDNSTVDISKLENGNYFFSILDERKNQVAKGKFSVNK
jgi:hypothetical protein